MNVFSSCNDVFQELCPHSVQSSKQSRKYLEIAKVLVSQLTSCPVIRAASPLLKKNFLLTLNFQTTKTVCMKVPNDQVQQVHPSVPSLTAFNSVAHSCFLEVLPPWLSAFRTCSHWPTLCCCYPSLKAPCSHIPFF